MKLRRIMALILCLTLLLSAFEALAYTINSNGEIVIYGSDESYTKSGCTAPALGSETGGRHYFTLTNIVDPTCTKDGKLVYTCQYCNKQESKTVPKLGHKWGEWDPYAPATCTKGALAARWCERCQAREDGTVGRPLGHDWDNWTSRQKATCTEEGLRWTDCNRCGWEKTEPIPALGHDWGEWYIETPATETTDGWYRRDCVRGDVYELMPYKLGEEPDESAIIEIVPDEPEVVLWLSAEHVGLKTEEMRFDLETRLTNLGDKTAEDYQINIFDADSGEQLGSCRVYDRIEAKQTAEDLISLYYTEEDYARGYMNLEITAWATDDLDAFSTVDSNTVYLTVYFGDEPAWQEGPALHVNGDWNYYVGAGYTVDARLDNFGDCDIENWTIYIYHIEPDGDGGNPYEYSEPETVLTAFGGSADVSHVVTPVQFELDQGYMEYGVFAVGFTSEGEYVESNDVTVHIPLDEADEQQTLTLSVWPDSYDSVYKFMNIEARLDNEGEGALIVTEIYVKDTNGTERYHCTYSPGTVVIDPHDYVDIDIPNVVATEQELTAGSTILSVYAVCENMDGGKVNSNEEYVEFIFADPTLLIVTWSEGYSSETETMGIGYRITNTGNEPVTLTEIWVSDSYDSRLIVDCEDKGIVIQPGYTVDSDLTAGLEHIVIPATEEELRQSTATLYVNCYGRSESVSIVDSNTVDVVFDLSKKNALLIDAYLLYYDAASREMHIGCDFMNCGDVELVLDNLYAINENNELVFYECLSPGSIILGPDHHKTDIAIIPMEYELEAGYSDMQFVAGAYTNDEAYVYVESNCDEVHVDFADSGETDLEPRLQLSLTASSVAGACLYMDGEVCNYDEDVTLHDWGIAVLNADDMSLNIDWTANSLSSTIFPGAAYSTDYAFDTIMYALADPEDIALGYKDLKAEAYAYTDDNRIVYSNIVELRYTFDTEPETPVEQPQYELKLVVGKVDDKPFYGEETVEFTYTISNEGTEAIMNLYIGIWYPDSFGDWAYPWEVINCLGPGESASGVGRLQLAFMNADENNVEHVKLVAIGFGTENVPLEHDSNIEYLVYQLDELIWTPPEREGAELEIEKSVANFARNGQYFQEGETIVYQIYVHNNSSVTAYDVEVYDLLKGANEDAKLDYMSALEPDGEWFLTYEHVVTAEEAEKGWISNTATCVWYDMSSELQKSAESSVRTRTGVLIPENVTVYKEVINTPANIYYFEPYETIYYRVTVYNNNDWDISNVWIDDTLAGAVYTGYSVIPAGYSITVEYSYEPTYADADLAGCVTNMATCYYQIDGKDAFNCVNSNEVTVPVGYIHRNAHLSTWMYEKSVPEHDGYYWLDEIIDYGILVFNDGAEDLYNVNVTAMRTLDDEPLEIGVIPYLPSGSYELMPTHTRVDSWDTDVVGYVLNFAIADTYLEDATFLMALSPEVTSPVSGTEPVQPYDPVKGEGKDDYCKLTLKSVQDGAESYEQYYCADHYNAAAACYAAVRDAQTPEDALTAWNGVRAAWISEIDEMYDEELKAVEPGKTATIVSERMLFYAYLRSVEALLNARYADAPETAAQELCTILAGKCSEMCFELNAPEGTRPDSYLSGHSVKSGAVSAEACSDLPGGIIARQLGFTLRFCEEHAGIAKTVRDNALRISDSSERAACFVSAQRKWITALNGCVSEAYNAADETESALIYAYRTAYGNYLNARMAVLDLVYAPAAAAEAAMREVMFEVMSNCD